MLETGTILGGRYEILKKIGTGGGGGGYKAKWLKTVRYTPPSLPPAQGRGALG